MTTCTCTRAPLACRLRQRQPLPPQHCQDRTKSLLVSCYHYRVCSSGAALGTPVTNPLGVRVERSAEYLLEVVAWPNSLVRDEARRREQEVWTELERKANLGGGGKAANRRPWPGPQGRPLSSSAARRRCEPGESAPGGRTTGPWRKQNGTFRRAGWRRGQRLCQSTRAGRTEPRTWYLVVRRKFAQSRSAARASMGTC